MFKQRNIKIYQKAKRQIKCLEIGKYLCCVNGRKCFDRLQLHNQAVSHKQIQSTFTNGMTFVIDTEAFLPLKSNTPQLQFDRHRLFIDTLQVSRSQ